MKIVIAPDSFKDALRAQAVAERIAVGFRAERHRIEFDLCPVSDGGEGFAEAIANALPDGQVAKHQELVLDPLERTFMGEWFELNSEEVKATSIIELAMASGLEHLSQAERDPVKTTTLGTGYQIRDALELSSCQTIVLGIGGSATIDGACGIVCALGGRFFDRSGDEILGAVTGSHLRHISLINLEQLHKRLIECEIRIACDVTNPLTGLNGAAHVYGPQKGATPEQVEELDAGLRHMAQLWRDQLGIDVEHLPGAGAAGGVGGGLVAMLGAELVPGAELVLDTIGFNERIKDADLVITGEGRLDSQSLQGKAAMTVAKRCKHAGVPCVALVGSVGEGAEQALEHGLSAYHVIGEGLPAEESIRRTGELLEQAAVKLAQERLLK